MISWIRNTLLLHLAFSCMVHAEPWQGDARAVVKEYVVDLFTELPVQERAPLAGTGYADGGCRRAHQLLLHEVVTLLERHGNYYKIACENAVYGLQDGVRLNTFWIHKKHLIPFRHLAAEERAAVPGPLGSADDTLVLIFPWKQFSFATRFVRAPEFDTEYSYGVNIVAGNGELHIEQIPRDCVRIEAPRSTRQKRNDFVQSGYDIIAYAHEHGACHEPSEPRVIPYVWGGSSFVYGYHDTFYLKHNRWERQGKHMPYFGYDCSELILRLGQASGIPFVAKTTTMIGQLLRPLTYDDALEQGDIIWFPGHVIIIGDIERNEMIEARGYKSGYGKVQCIKLSECFRGISNYRQLRRAYFRKRPLVRLKKDGTVENVIKEFKLLKLL